ncbi:hypothetical protein [Streptomyces sp. NPDC052701]
MTGAPLDVIVDWLNKDLLRSPEALGALVWPQWDEPPVVRAG